jgi:ABC-2 type transport system permease protein
VFGVLFLLVIGYLTYSLDPNTAATMQLFFTFVPVLFAIFLPALAMRLWAEERKLGTLELLMTFPVTVPQLILGKFLAAFLLLLLLLVLTLPYPIVLSIYGNLDWGPVILGYVGAMLLASAYVAVGMLFSSLTREQIVACLLALGTLFFLTIIGHPAIQIKMGEALPDWVIAFFSAISPFTYFSSITTRGPRLARRDLLRALRGDHPLRERARPAGQEAQGVMP